MAWIESHQTLRNHPKIVRAARALGISRVTMYGHMHCLWWWAMDYAQDGDISAFDPEDIAEAAEWEGNADAFIAALLESARIGDKPGLLEMVDGALCIHDWYDYAGKLIDKRKADAARKRDERRKEQLGTPDGMPSDVRGTSEGHPTDVAGTVPNHTVPNQPDQPDPTEPTTTPGLVRRADGKGMRPSRQSSSDLGLVCTGYEQMLGQTLTPGVSDTLWDWLADDKYPAAWIVEAMQESKNASKTDLRYVGGILRNWKSEGKNSDRRNGKTRKHGEPTADELRARYVPATYADIVQS